jgi:hypothetical protein
VPVTSHFAIFTRVVLLPLALALGSVAGLGSYYETSDDGSLSWLFAGVLALKPVASVPLYFHGYGHLMAAAYTAVPGVPWYGLLLGSLLAGASILAFAVLDRLLRPHLRPAQLILVLVLFFGVAWLEHWLWFSHVRVALLLAGTGVLFAAQRPERRGALLLGLLALGAAWLVRPGMAVLGAGAVLPAAWLLAGSWRRAAPTVVAAVLGLALLTGGAALSQSGTEAQAQARNGAFARVLDFGQLRPQPRTAADSLGTAALNLWLLGDSTVVNEALVRRAYRLDATDFFGREVPTKLAAGAALLVRDYFPLLLAVAAMAFAIARRRQRPAGFWLVQLGFAGLLVLLAGLLKLPPRLALPLLDFWLLTNLALWLKAASATLQGIAANTAPRPVLGRFPRIGIAAVLGIELLYGAKIVHRRHILGQERSSHELAMAEIGRRATGQPRVLAGTTDLLKSLSPFRVYGLGTGPVLSLSGWPAHDPSQRLLRQSLAVTSDQTECLRRLAALARNTQWLLSVETAQWLNRRFRYAPGVAPAVRLHPGIALAADTSLRFYQPDFAVKTSAGLPGKVLPKPLQRK